MNKSTVLSDEGLYSEQSKYHACALLIVGNYSGFDHEAIANMCLSRVHLLA